MQRSIKVLRTYAIEAHLYSRGLAQGYRARDEQLGDIVVLEVVPMLEDTPERRAFLAQYRSVAVKIMRLRHPNMVAIRDFVVDRHQFFLVKQYDSGVTLDALLFRSRGANLELEVRVSLCMDILRGLSALHRSNIIHRDVKTHGVFVKDQPEYLAQLDNFHLAVSGEAEYLDNNLCGTPVYMSPEIIKTPRQFTKQSDVYAAGLLAVEVLSGRSVLDLMRLDGFEVGEPADLFSYVVSRGRHISESRLRASVPPKYADVLVCATEPNRVERFADCRAFYESFAQNAPMQE